MFDRKTRKMFLRRCVVPSGLDKKDLFVGNTIVVFARHLLIKDYSNEYTRNQVENDKQTTLILIYPDAHQDLGHVISSFDRAQYSLCRVRSMKFNNITAREFLDRYVVKGKGVHNSNLNIDMINVKFFNRNISRVFTILGAF